MVKLLIIADDFTGALDTGVQFSSAGINTKVIVDQHLEVKREETNQVLVIDAETRHLSCEQAYKIVYEIVASAVDAGIPYIYKKTDSALRGNIGSELSAVMLAAKAEVLPFAPAFPKMNRITRNGIHYIDEVPVSKSVFGIDPFEPVTKDSVREIIQLQADTNVSLISESERSLAGDKKGILVFDADTEDALKEIAEILKKNELCHVMAGCAGFAAILPELLELEGETKAQEATPDKLLVVCGSVNPITRKQLAYGASIGYEKFDLIPEQKLHQSYWTGGEGEKLVETIRTAMDAGDCCIVDSNDLPGTNATMEYAKDHGMTLEDVRVRISRTLGMAAKQFLMKEIPVTFLITGGDTLLGLMKQIGANELMPIGEVAPGSVLTKLEWNQKAYYIITKSGGFGDENLLELIVGKLKNNRLEDK